MPLWLDGYEHVQITGCTGPGTYVDGYSWRWVAHTTESPGGSMDGIISLFKSNPCSTPHFAVDPATGRKVQFIPIDWSAAALRGGRGGYETNRGRAVQTEIIGYAKDQQDRSTAELEFLGHTINSDGYTPRRKQQQLGSSQPRIPQSLGDSWEW